MKKLVLPLCMLAVCLVVDKSTRAIALTTTSPIVSSWLNNISTRAFVETGDDVVIAGFIVQGSAPKSVIIRAIGPELAHYGVPDPLANFTLELHEA